MKILKFEQFTRRQRRKRGRQSVDLIKILAVAGTLIAVLSAAVWLIRDGRDLQAKFGPYEGSLIVNINTATQDELISIPGVGPTRAAQIVAGRPYASVDELARIAGISGKTLESLRPFVTIDGETRKRER